MYKILILAYLIGADPVITQQNFEMQGWYKTMQECQANLLKQHPDNLPAMKSIKRSMDPNNIMNPGKIFDLN